MFTPDRILALCRPGFESDTAAELADRAVAAQSWGHARTRDGEGLLEFFPGEDPYSLLLEGAFAQRVFARQLVAVGELVEDLPAGDRLAPLLEGFETRVSGVVVESAEGDSFRPLARLASQLTGPLKGLLQQRGLFTPGNALAPRAHVILASGTSAWFGLAPAHVSSPDPGGVVRLRQQRGAPSRSALKLEEALKVMLTEERGLVLFNGRPSAVDLGAAPGGWSWVLRRRGARVVAVDNGAMDRCFADDPDFEHVRADAFTYKPPGKVDWLVCDVVDKPARVVELMARWLRRDWARRALFNLKLPMQRRWHAVVDARKRFEHILGDAAGDHDLQIRHLYHDREEVTCLAQPRR